MLSFLAPAIILLAQNRITYELPDNSKPDDIVATSKAIKARIVEYGYKEIWVRDGLGKIVLDSAIPFTDEMKPKLDQLCLKKANDLQIRFVHPMTEAEAEQFKPGIGAPIGTSWTKIPSGWLLFNNAPVLQVNNQATWKKAHPGPPSMNLTFNENLMHIAWTETATKLLQEHSREIPKCRLMIDGQFIEGGMNITFTGNTMKWTFNNTDHWEVLGVCINHPLPLQLTKPNN
jgi:hypothetical protein